MNCPCEDASFDGYCYAEACDEKVANKQLCERYPFLIPRNVWTDKIPEDYDYRYINGIEEIPKGWNKLFLQMCEDIRQPLIDNNYLDKFRFVQIKEKYNTLRLYNNGAPQEVLDIFDKYEYLSQFICHKCGKPATKETTGWIASYCDDCLPNNEHTNPIKFNPILHICRFSNGGKCDVYIDCSDEWRRLYA